MLVQFLAPLRRPDACRDAGYEWHLDNRVERFEYCADYSRKAGYLRRCSHTSTGEGAAGLLEMPCLISANSAPRWCRLKATLVVCV